MGYKIQWYSDIIIKIGPIYCENAYKFYITLPPF
jgi:hypothetical protein